MTEDAAQPHIASFMILRRGNKIAFVLRTHTTWMNGYYGLPSGKVKVNESFSAAAIREAQEEVGVKVDPKNLQFVHAAHRFSHDSDHQDWIDVYFEAKTWEGEPYNAEPTIHGELAWLDLNNLPENIVPPVRAALEQIANGHAYSEFDWPTTSAN